MIKVYRELQQLPVFARAVVTVGTFDGVHTGHRQIIKLLKEEAKNTGGNNVIITFYPHPRMVVSKDNSAIKVLNTLEEKIELLDKSGIENLVVIPFDKIFAAQSAEAYVQHFLVEKFHPQTIIIGYDHKFGNNRSGDYHLLEKLGEKFNYKVKEIPGHMLNEVTVSSTKIRQALEQSDVATANELLGYNYFLEGNVTPGARLGRTIGYPTANIAVNDSEKLIPCNGVYAVQVSIEGANTLHGGMMNIGLRPTVSGTTRTIEVNIFDFNENIYDRTVRVSMVAYLRAEIKFNGIELLKEQLGRDEKAARELLNGN